MTNQFETEHPREATGKFVEKTNSAPTTTLTKAAPDLTRQTPVEVDAQLADLYMQWATVRTQAIGKRNLAERYRNGRYPNAGYADELDSQAEDLEMQASVLELKMHPFESEFTRRGGWTRAFYVVAAGGHVHSSRSCSTCYDTTQYLWLTDYSGRTEDEVVADAGKTACTVCYPSAPVDVLQRERRFRIPSDDERDARAAEKQRRAGEKAAKAITNPDGTTLEHDYHRVNTLVSAERELVDVLHDILVDEQVYRTPNREHAAGKGVWRDKLIAAIAHKRDLTAEEVLAEYAPKAEKKLARTKREWNL